MTSFTTLLILCLLPCALSHTFLTSPDAYNRVFQLRNCKDKKCSRRACPSELPSEMRNTRAKPAAVWSRGQKVRVSWARNNHLQGIVRLAIVPYKNRMDRAWHKRLAIWYGCFSQGKSPCEGEACGSDKSGYSNGADITVPSHIPDGDYVLGLVWYGGVHWPLTKGTFFSDYWSCSFIKIQGGTSVGGYMQPKFHPGDDPFALKNNGKCMTAIDAPGECPNEGCKGPAVYSVPREFKDGKRPKRVDAREVRKAM